MTLFEASELKSWLHYDDESDFVAADAELAEQVVAGWLSDAAEVDDINQLITTPSPRLKGWAIELGGIAYENPTSMSSDRADEIGSEWQIDRRRQILERVRAWARSRPGAASTTPLPRGCFPPAQAWPESATARRW